MLNNLFLVITFQFYIGNSMLQTGIVKQRLGYAPVTICNSNNQKYV